MIFTLKQLEILIHYGSKLCDYEDLKSVESEQAMDSLLKQDYVYYAREGQYGRDFNLTDKGVVLLSMLQNTPHPTQVWADPRTGQVVKT